MGAKKRIAKEIWKKFYKFVAAAIFGYEVHELTDELTGESMQNKVVPYSSVQQVPYPKPNEDDLGANDIVLILLFILLSNI